MPENVEDEDLFGENEAEETIDFGEEASVISAADFTGDSEDQRLARSLKQDELDEKFGFARYKINDLRTGYLVNMQSAEVQNEETRKLTAVVDYYFVNELNERFKVAMPYNPYFFIKTKDGCEIETATYLQRKYGHVLTSVTSVWKEDLELLNHLSGIRQKFVMMSFLNVTDMTKVKRDLMPIARRNRERLRLATNTYGLQQNLLGGLELDYTTDVRFDPTDNVVDIREYDVPHHVRVAIDKQIFVGHWYDVTPLPGPCLVPIINRRDDLQEPPDVVVCAYDIETTKAPLKFPDPAIDQVMMISYMINGRGFLVVNREVVSQDIMPFEYTPKAEFEGKFHVFNEEDEKQLIMRFFKHLLQTKPVIFSTYNGDFFDWPFVEARAKFHGISMYDQIGFCKVGKEEFLSHCCIHMDCFKWVQRDSYLPVGSQNLKAVCKNKLRYNPVELDPEEMLRMAIEQPQVLADYSVSDAVATYYLYMKYVHTFIFALCTIIPMEPDSVLRKGSGTLCEALLMVEAYKANVIFPNKHETPLNKMTKDGHVVESETYIGGHVEALESGIFRADLPLRFRLVMGIHRQYTLNARPNVSDRADVGRQYSLCRHIFQEIPAKRSQGHLIAFTIQGTTRLICTASCTRVMYLCDAMVSEGIQKLIDNVERTVTHALVEEEKVDIAKVMNFDEVCNAIKDRLISLRDDPNRNETPMIYHLDVAAMYPNIILTNRLQPSAIVQDDVCAACHFNRPQNQCRRKMKWTWRGEHMPATRSEFHKIQQQLETEKFPSAIPNGPPRAFHQLGREERAQYEKKRLTEFCRKNYKRIHITREEPRESVVCQRENSFYVDTVRMFRDKRYEHKTNLKLAKQDVAEAQRAGNSEKEKKAKAMEVVYDSLQLAHKCILNSFYGYVMRRGARWYSMEMAGIVCYTGGAIIKRARQIVEQIGRPLELDTDGIWCALPKSFPDAFKINVDGSVKGITINYPGAMLNVMVRDEFSNHQYQELTDGNMMKYTKRIENSIAFEVDGPYLAMILPAAKEEGKRLKKRYAVFNFDGSLAELKGFEVKRRGELQLIKLFQSSVFETFLLGGSLQECYTEVAKIADQWLDILYTKGGGLTDSELFELISENRNMSKKITEYGALKSTSITTARRLAEFLGDSVLKGGSLNCRYIIAKKPDGAPTAERAIPYAIWQANDQIRIKFLKKWLRVPALETDDIRAILDWDYYIERLNGTIMKIVTIPAAMQSLPNPVPRVPYPDWLHKRVQEHNDIFKQKRITDMFKPMAKLTIKENHVTNDLMDIEAVNGPGERPPPLPVQPMIHKKRKAPPGPAIDVAPVQKWQDVLGPPPPKGTTAHELLVWLEFHRKKWDYMRRHKDHRKKTRTESFTSGIRVQGSGVGAFVQQTRKRIIEENWQIVEVAETGHPGLYKIWILLDDTMHAIKMKVFRTFYINRKIPRTNEDGKIVRKVTKVLPRSKPTYHLYEYRVEEEAFQKHQNELLNDLTDPFVEGVYETQIPLMFRIMCSVGSICRIKPQKRRDVAHRETEIYLLEDVERVFDAKVEYLPNGILNPIYFYFHQSGDKALFALVFIKQKTEIVIARDTVKVNNFPAKLDAVYRRLRRERMDQDGLPPEDQAFLDKHVETNFEKIYSMLNKRLNEFLGDRHGPSVIYLHGKQDHSYWITKIAAMAHFPVVPTHVEDDAQAYNNFASLSWQPTACQIMINRFLDLNSVLMESLEKSRYFDVPWGNTPKAFARFLAIKHCDSDDDFLKDSTVYACDLFYARLLQSHNMIMWGTPKDRPDFGGKETDDIRLIAEDEEKVLQINHPKLYETCTVQVEVDYMAVCAILLGQHVHGSEGVSASTNFDRAPQARLEDQIRSGIHVIHVAGYDESAQVDYAFSILSSMVKNIFREALEQNVHADELAVHVFRWLRSPTSLLYDPALHRKLIGIMRKMLLKLVTDCKTYGCEIVHATGNWMVLSTNKGNVHEAVAQVRYTVDKVREADLFRALLITPKRAWTILLWLDAANFSGIVVEHMPEEVDTTRIHDKSFVEYFGDVSFFSQEQGDPENPDIRYLWNLATFLPQPCEEIFKEIVTGYISQASVQYQDYFRKINRGEIVPRRQFEDEDKEAEVSEPVENLRDLVRGWITQTMLAKLQTILRRFPPGAKERVHGEVVAVFPVRPGSHLHMQNPALELVKAMCKVLSLHTDVREQVRKLKRDLLKMIGVGEFSSQAEWVDPCVTYVLPEVICASCSSCRDLDLCRERPKPDHFPPVWACPSCQETHDSSEVEQRLFVALRKMNVAYHLQDLKCSKCKQIFERHVARTCSCGGEFRNTITREAFLEKLRIFQNVSSHFQMQTLNETVTWMLQANTLAQRQPQK